MALTLKTAAFYHIQRGGPWGTLRIARIVGFLFGG